MSIDTILTSQYNSVVEFMKTFSQKVYTEKRIPTFKEYKLRIDLITEEISELKVAIKNDDLVEIVDALADILYVVYGAFATFGISINESLSNSDSDEYYEARHGGATLPDILSAFQALSQMEVAIGEISYDTLFKQPSSMTEKQFFGNICHSLNTIVYKVYRLAMLMNVPLIACFNEVHGSNMSKVLRTEEDAHASIALRILEGKADYDGAYVIENTGKFLIKRASDNKVLKGADYYEPDLQKYLL